MSRKDRRAQIRIAAHAWRVRGEKSLPDSALRGDTYGADIGQPGITGTDLIKSGDVMSKEFEKFEKDYKKLQPKLKKYTNTEAGKISKRIKNASSTSGQGEINLIECCATARENGVTGNNLKDFMADKSFQEGLKLYDRAFGMFQEECKNAEKFCKEADDAYDDLARLYQAMEKDLKKRKDKSASKKDIEELKTKLEKAAPTLKAVSQFYGKMPPAYHPTAADFQKTVNNIIKKAPAEQAKQKADTVLPQQLHDRVINKNHNICVKAAKDASALVDAAMKKAETDLKAATPALKKASELVKLLKTHNDTYGKIKRDYADALKNSKDAAKIHKMIDVIAKAYAATERKVRGAVTTIRKAA